MTLIGSVLHHTVQTYHINAQKATNQSVNKIYTQGFFIFLPFELQSATLSSRTQCSQLCTSKKAQSSGLMSVLLRVQTLSFFYSM